MIAHSLGSQCCSSFPLFLDELAGFLLRIRHEFASSARHIVLGDLIVVLRISVKLAECHHIGSGVSAYVELGELLAATSCWVVVPANEHGASKHLAGLPKGIVARVIRDAWMTAWVFPFLTGSAAEALW